MRHGYVQTDDNENLLCSVIVCYPSAPPPQTRVALSRESKATTLPGLGNGSDVKPASKKKKKEKSDLGTVPSLGLGEGLTASGTGSGTDGETGTRLPSS